MYNVGKAVIIDLIIKLYCDVQNFDYEKLSSDDYLKMYNMYYKLDDNILIARMGELYNIIQN